MRRAVIVDLSWCLHRFAYVHQNLKVVRQGQAIFTGTIYGMALLGQSLWRPENKIIFAMDDKDKERAEIVPSYKANRPKNKEVYDLMHPIVSVLSLLPKVSFDYAEGKEADDIIAQRAFELKGEGYETWVFSSDNDFLQLMPYNIFVADRMENTQLIPRSVDYVFDKYGVHPRHILQFRSVIGDPSDNIKAAVPRMDRKVLRKFVVDWQENGFEKAVERIEKDKIREKLQEGKSAILDNLKVMSLVKYRNEKHRFEIQSLDGGSKEDGIRNVRHYGLSVYENFLQRMNCVE